MRVLVVVESCFGNTHQVAAAVAQGLNEQGHEVEVLAAAAAPAETSADLDLVVVAAPTHSLGLPNPRTRAQAAASGATPVATGVLEWLQTAKPGARLVAIDTAVPGIFSGSAAKKARTLAERRGWQAESGGSFVVTGTKGPLREGELERARKFGAGLG